MTSQERVQTGGAKEFVITQEDRKRWETENTNSNLAFREELRLWQEHPYRFYWKHRKVKIIAWACLFILIIAALLFNKQIISFFK
jgi:hypothetical protein